jgi:anti-sigma B factor antagonist
MLTTTEKKDQVFVVTLNEKRLDAALAPKFDQQMSSYLTDGYKKILIDFTEVDFMDSTGLGSLVACLKELGDARQLVLCGVSAKIMSLFKLTRMDRIFVIFGNREEAFTYLSSQ